MASLIEFAKIMALGFVVLGVVYMINGYTQRRAPGPMAEPTVNVQTLKATANYLDPRLYIADPDGYEGKPFWIRGKALGVEQEDGYTWINMQAMVRDRSSTESIIVFLTPPQLAFLKDECYRVFGFGAGTSKAIRTLTGVEFDAPTMRAYAYYDIDRETEYSCEAP